MRKVLFDTNIILDIALKREAYFKDARELFSLIDAEQIEGYATASTITDIYYISKKEKGHSETISFIINLLEVLEVIGVNKETIIKAVVSSMNDFEDAVQVSAAELHNLDLILTRNVDDFSDSSLKVLTPKDFLSTVNR